MKSLVIKFAALSIAMCCFVGSYFFSLAQAEADGTTKVSGSNCIPPVPEVGYRPSLFECNGNAAILLRGSFRSAYSVVVRFDGQYNDRDPRNPSCTTNRCSPFKIQKRIELPEYQVNCLGETGYSQNYTMINRISIKFQAQVTNARDPRQFEQYCLASKTTDLN